MSETKKLGQKLLLLEPQYRERVWGGRRLKAAEPPVGEAWVGFEESRVAAGPHAGRTLAELAAEYGAELLGVEVWARYGARFPLLAKLLDCADWLSVQVHPDDDQARRLVGPTEFGKTEAWHFLEADEGATILAGVKPGTTAEALEQAIRAGDVFGVAQRLEVRPGQSLLIPAGTLHALRPGLLLYELQQSSDTTFRVYDWGRPVSAGRSLHIEESIAVTDPRRSVEPVPPPQLQGTALAHAVACPHFELDLLQIAGPPLKADTARQSFHLLTVAEGEVALTCAGETLPLARHQTALVAGCADPYEVSSPGFTSRVLRAAVPSPGR